jgi:U3 small nucleolar RNA-associated protein 21
MISHLLIILTSFQVRNKPKDAPKAPEQAPFFLPTVTNLDDGLGTRFDIPSKATDDDAGRKQDFSSAFVESDFTVRLSKEDPAGGCE